MKRINEIIGQEYKQWKKGDLIFITAGTGVGKSYFIENTLDEYCIDNRKKILYLTNRNILKEQVKKDLENFTNITVLNYQKIEEFILNHVYFDNYDYVVCDEAHYFFTDSSFSSKTDLFFKMMLSDNSICKILMTATPQILNHYFDKKDIHINYKYELKTNYNYINEIVAFDTWETVESIIEEIPKDEKILLFGGTKKVYEISKKYNGAFICSENNKDGFYKYVKGTKNEEEKNNIIENGKFENHLLCCTTVLDNGINIKDKEVKHIIIDILDRDELIQCLGRKRIIDESEKINLYFYSYKNDNKRINGFKSKIASSLDKANYLTRNGEKKYVHHKFKNEKFTDTRIIDDVVGDNDGEIHKVINDCIYTKYTCDLIMYNSILEKQYDITYKSIIALQLGINPLDIIEMETTIKKLSLEEALERIIGNRLYKNERKELIEFIGLKDARGRLQKSIKQLNAYFEANKIDYIIKSKRVKVEGKLYTVWIVGKIDYSNSSGI